MSKCVAVQKNGLVCSRNVIDSPDGYADKTLDFAHYCSIHIWGHFAGGTENSRSYEKVQVVQERQVAAFWKAPEPRQLLPKTAAQEALILCRKFYPWRIRQHLEGSKKA